MFLQKKIALTVKGRAMLIERILTLFISKASELFEKKLKATKPIH